MEFERKRSDNFQLNIAPLVDVVFLLLLFFMLTSHIIEEPVVKIKLPGSKTAANEAKAVKTIAITNDGKIYFMEKKVDLTELQTKLEEATDDKETIKIKADKDASVDVLMKVVDTIRLSGISNFAIVTENADKL